MLMPSSITGVSRLLSMIADHIDVPRSYYEKARDRHRSLGEWLHRKESVVASFSPDVRPQGSFRYGTVIRPVREGESYDLDNICVLQALAKTFLTQKQLKELYGGEIRAYAVAHNMLRPPTEHNRCWRLPYADEVDFHLDTLPCIPEEAIVIQRLADQGVMPHFANCAVAITDRRHPLYGQITTAWPSSNPRGFARFFEAKAAMGRSRALLEGRIQAAIEDVPPYEWKTTLQQSIQLLKRHRDVMFYDNADLAPISMIITNLAANAYGGETDLFEAITNIVAQMPVFVRATRPRVPNPTQPEEDYADKWSKDPALEQNFWRWHSAVKVDLQRLPSFLANGNFHRNVGAIFRVDLTQEEIGELEFRTERRVPAIVKAAPAMIIPSAPRPWGCKW
jgi:hypothetical protein